jgi:hypothetical protein
MFLGHLAVGFAAKPAAPRMSLAVLILATQLADTLWPVFVGLGLEVVEIDPGNTAVTPLNFISYPYSHSLLTMAIYGVAFAWIVAKGAPGRPAPQSQVFTGRSSIALLCGLVVSHWVLDFVTHRPDMPLYPGGGPKLGLGLWNSVAATVLVEMSMFATAVWTYLRSTRPRDGIGRWALVALIVFLVIVYAGNIAGPPPPSVDAIWVSAVIAIPILTVWAWWVDRHRAII